MIKLEGQIVFAVMMVTTVHETVNGKTSKWCIL